MKQIIKSSNSILILISLFIFSLCLNSCNEDCDCEEIVPELFQVDLSEFKLIRVKQYEVICGVEIDDQEIDSVLELGIVLSQNLDPELDVNAERRLVADSVVEEFVGIVGELATATSYHLRAYAITKLDTNYSEQISFTTIAENGTRGTVTDVDGNTYETLILGGLEWMLENLKVTHYRDGSDIVTGVSDEDYGDIDFGSYGIYPNRKINGFESDEEVLAAYGALYNWYAVIDERGLSPEGWHIPTDQDWIELEIFLGMSKAQAYDTDFRGSDQGAMLKSTNTLPDPHPSWKEGNIATNSTGFNAISGGARYENGNFGYKEWYTSFWTSTEVGTSSAWARTLSFDKAKIARNINHKNLGYSIRCVKD